MLSAVASIESSSFRASSADKTAVFPARKPRPYRARTGTAAGAVCGKGPLVCGKGPFSAEPLQCARCAPSDSSPPSAGRTPPAKPVRLWSSFEQCPEFQTMRPKPMGSAAAPSQLQQRQSAQNDADLLHAAFQ
jgi:hypothetical protein